MTSSLSVKVNVTLSLGVSVKVAVGSSLGDCEVSTDPVTELE